MEKLFSKGEIDVLLVGTEGDEHLRKMFEEFRYKEYVEHRGWENENKEKIEKDSFDSYSHYVILLASNNLIAGFRLIDGNKGPLPIGRKLENVLDNSVEISRYLIAKKTPLPQGLRVNCIMYKAVYMATEKLGFEHLYADIRERLLKALRIFSIKSFAQVGEKHSHGEAGTLVPVVQSINAMRKTYSELNPI